MATTLSWNPDELRDLLPEFDWNRLTNGQGNIPGRVTEAWETYQSFYRLADISDGYQHQIGREEIAGYQIAIQTWFHPQARGNLLMVHGYYDHVGLYGSIIELCQKHQLNLVCFDLPGHGLSSGEPAAIDSFQTYQRVLQSIFTKASKNLKGSWIGLGQSTGGGILADYALSRTQPEFKQLILMAPLLQPRGWNSGRWVHSLARLFIRRLKRKFGFGGNNPEFSQFVSQDPLQSLYLSVSWVTAMKVWIREMKMKEPVSQPVVLIQGTRDETVDWKHNTRRYSSLFQNLKLHWVEGGHHHLVNETDMRWKQIEKILTDTILENFS